MGGPKTRPATLMVVPIRVRRKLVVRSGIMSPLLQARAAGGSGGRSGGERPTRRYGGRTLGLLLGVGVGGGIDDQGPDEGDVVDAAVPAVAVALIVAGAVAPVVGEHPDEDDAGDEPEGVNHVRLLSQAGMRPGSV